MSVSIMHKAASKSELARRYSVAYSTFRNWLAQVPDLNLLPGQRVLTPRQVEKVLAHLGEP